MKSLYYTLIVDHIIDGIGYEVFSFSHVNKSLLQSICWQNRYIWNYEEGEYCITLINPDGTMLVDDEV